MKEKLEQLAAVMEQLAGDMTVDQMTQNLSEAENNLLTDCIGHCTSITSAVHQFYSDQTPR